MRSSNATFCNYATVIEKPFCASIAVNVAATGDGTTCTSGESSRRPGHESTIIADAANSISRFDQRRTDSTDSKNGPCSDDSSVSSASTTCNTSTSAGSGGKASTSCRKRQEKGQSPRSVHFNESIRCLVIPGVWQMPQHEIDDIWHGPADSLRQKKEMKRTVHHMRSHGLDQGEAMDESKYCYRGLEHLRSAAALQRRQQEQSLTINTVLEAQDASSFAPSYLAAVYEAATKRAKKRAIFAAKRDEAEAIKCMHRYM